VVAVAASSLILGPGALAHASPGEATVFPIPGPSGGPRDITLGDDGNLWFTNPQASTVVRITPSGVMTPFADPDEDVQAPHAITPGPNGTIWFTDELAGLMGRVTPAGDLITHFSVDFGTVEDIVQGSDGAMWFTRRSTDSIGRIEAGTVTVHTDPEGEVDAPNGIAAGLDGNVWFTSQENARLGHITPGGNIRTFEDPEGDLVSPGAITDGPDGALWFTDQGADLLGRVDLFGHVTTFAAPGLDDPAGITTGPDGSVWFANQGTDEVGRISPFTGTIELFPAGVDSPTGIVGGPDGAVWYTGQGDDTVGRLDVCSAPFVDVGATHPFRDDVCWMDAQGISTGYDDDTFRPSAVVSRQAMSAFLYRLAGADVVDPPTATFSDVSSDHPFFTEIEWMAQAEISTGYDDDTYRPSASVSRQAMAAFLERFADAHPEQVLEATFTDVSLDHPFSREVEWMAQAEISTGYDDDTFRPSAPVTRQAMSAFLHRLVAWIAVDRVPSQ
jgi:virginiamycin B lyase